MRIPSAAWRSPVRKISRGRFAARCVICKMTLAKSSPSFKSPHSNTPREYEPTYGRINTSRVGVSSTGCWPTRIARTISGERLRETHEHRHIIAPHAKPRRHGVDGVPHDRLLDCIRVIGELVADRGPDEVGTIGVESFVHQQIDMAKIDESDVSLVSERKTGQVRAAMSRMCPPRTHRRESNMG